MCGNRRIITENSQGVSPLCVARRGFYCERAEDHTIHNGGEIQGAQESKGSPLRPRRYGELPGTCQFPNAKPLVSTLVSRDGMCSEPTFRPGGCIASFRAKCECGAS